MTDAIEETPNAYFGKVRSRMLSPHNLAVVLTGSKSLDSDNRMQQYVNFLSAVGVKPLYDDCTSSRRIVVLAAIDPSIATAATWNYHRATAELFGHSPHDFVPAEDVTLRGIIDGAFHTSHDPDYVPKVIFHASNPEPSVLDH